MVNSFQLFGVLLFGKIYLNEFCPLVGIIPGVYSDLFNDCRRFFGRIGIKMDVGHQGRSISGFYKFFLDIDEILGFTDTLRGQPYQFTSGLYYPHTLGNRSIGIKCIGVGHRLYPYRPLSSKGQIAHHHGNRYIFFIAHNECDWRFWSATFLLVGYGPTSQTVPSLVSLSVTPAFSNLSRILSETAHSFFSFAS